MKVVVLTIAVLLFLVQLVRGSPVASPNQKSPIIRVEVQPGEDDNGDTWKVEVVVRRTKTRNPLLEYTELPQHGYYRVGVVPLSWTNASAQCASEGAHLMVPSSLDETEAVKDLVYQRTGGGRNLLIGLTDSAQEGSFVTVTGEPLGFNSWHQNEPNNRQWASEDEDCVLLESGLLNDVRCSEELPYVCEMPPGALETSLRKPSNNTVQCCVN